MISKKYKCVHVHINKAAGSSIERMLGYSTTGADHRTIHEYKEVLGGEIKNYFTFAFVRNPWDKIVSQYHHRKQNMKDDRILNMNFKNWVHNLDTLGFDIKGTGNQLDWLCENRWLWNPAKKAYTKRPYKIKLAVDYIGRFENFEDDWSIICNKIGLVGETCHTKKSQHADYREYYDDKTSQIIYDRFIDDIKFFKYKF